MLFSKPNNKASVFLLILALIVCGVGAQATGVLNTPTGGYLVCVNTATKVVTHPGTSSCPKGSKRIVLGAQGVAGAQGLTGATGLSGKDGVAGKDGKTLWNGTTDPANTWGAPGDMYINSVTKTLFGPKDFTTGWPVGVSMIGPKGDQGPIGLTGATGPQGPSGGSGPAGPTGAKGDVGATGVAAPVATGENCIATKCTYKIGETGPGGGLIFFVDYFDQYSLNYLEAAPASCEVEKPWSSDTSRILVAVNGWAGHAVGRGRQNTIAMLTSIGGGYNADTTGAAAYSDASSCGGKTDWFLGSRGEMKLMFNNLQGVDDFRFNRYWTSTGVADPSFDNEAYTIDFDGVSVTDIKGNNNFVRPIRSF